MEQNQRTFKKSLWISVHLGNLLSVTAGLLYVSAMYGQRMIEYNLEDWLNMTWWLVAILPLGAICGALLGGISTHLFGRKHTIVALKVLFTLSFLIAAFSTDNTTTLFSVFLGGVSTGGTFVALTIYQVEISEVTNRSKICSTINAGYCMGALVSILIGINASVTTYNVVCAVIAGASAILFYLYAQETPQFFISKNNEATAKLIMQKLRCTLYVDQEILEIKDTLISSKNRIRAQLLCLALFAFQPLSGTSLGVSYVNLFHVASGEVSNTFQVTTMFFAPFVASMLVILLVEHLGEKKLLLLSAVGVLIPQVIIAIYLPEFPNAKWVAVVVMLMLKCFYAAGLAVLPWILSAQLQPCKLRPILLGITSSLTWLLTFVVSGYYQSVVSNLGFDVYWAFPVFNLLAVGFVVLLLPDISKKTSKEINELL